jgi:hypothetical protein
MFTANGVYIATTPPIAINLTGATGALTQWYTSPMPMLYYCQCACGQVIWIEMNGTGPYYCKDCAQVDHDAECDFPLMRHG